MYKKLIQPGADSVWWSANECLRLRDKIASTRISKNLADLDDFIALKNKMVNETPICLSEKEKWIIEAALMSYMRNTILSKKITLVLENKASIDAARGYLAYHKGEPTIMALPDGIVAKVTEITTEEETRIIGAKTLKIYIQDIYVCPEKYNKGDFLQKGFIKLLHGQIINEEPGNPCFYSILTDEEE